MTAIVVVALVMTAVSNGLPAPTGEPSGAPSASLRPTSTPAVTAPPDEAWGDLALPAWEPVAELRPVSVNASGVAVDTAFTLRSRSTVAAVDLAAGLTADPSIMFDVRPGATAAEATIVPAEPLAEGVVYRFRLADPTGALTGSWAYRTEEPLHVVGTVPGNQATGVPVTTGIEVEFDQDGVSDISDQFSIDPAVAGRFEVHGRTIAFVPNAPLASATTYRVSIAAGVTLSGSDQILEAPASFAFETAVPAGATAAWDVGLGRPVLESSPGQAPLIGVDVFEDGRAAALSSLPFEVYQLPSFDAARAAAVMLAGDSGWGEWRSTSLVDVAGLPRIAAFDGTFESTSPAGYRVIRFPAPLPAGWYVVVVPREGRDRQVLLQVTTLSAFALTSETRTLAWVNDVATGEPVAGADVRDPAGSVIGTTGIDGLLDVATPSSLQRLASEGASYGQASIASVSAPDGRQLLLALGQRSNTIAYDQGRDDLSQVAAPDHRWWRLLGTDRTAYRSTDTVHAWGLIRSRLDGSVPAGLELTVRNLDGSSEVGPWISRVPVSATARGAWAADVEIEDLPLGGYIVELHAAGEVVSEAWLQVVEIRKPAYRIEVATEPRAVIAGDPVVITGRALFFDGTPAAGLDLVIAAFGQDHPATTDAEGRVTLKTNARTNVVGIDVTSVGIRPVDPEEAEIAGSAPVVVLASATWISAAGTVGDGNVVITGMVSRVDLDRVDQELELLGWPSDPSGSPIAGATVTARVVASIPVERQVGTTYDYLEKQVIPVMEYTYHDQTLGTYTTTSAADGSIAVSVPASVANASYTATLTARDGSGRIATTSIYAAPAEAATLGQMNRPYLGESRPCEVYVEDHTVGDTIDLTMRDGDGTTSSGGRYLFVVAGRGIRDVQLQDTATLTRTYAAADLPNIGVIAVRFLDGVYVVTNEAQIRTTLDEQTLGVAVTADRSRYAPGDRATLGIRTTDADGNPVAADVVLRAVDEKLFALGQAFEVDALGELMAPLGDGLLQSYASHPVPLPGPEGCGDTSGGGRDDFRDSALFRLVSTDADGRASIEFDLPDDLTSWHVSATALTGDFRAGSGSALVPVGLPFFVDAILSPDFLVGERPILRVRSFGDGLATGERIRYTVSAPSLLMPPTTVDAASFATASVKLPDLPLGIHEVTISASVIGDPTRKDALVRRIIVRSSRLEVATTEVATTADAGAIGGAGLTTYVVTDAGRGAMIPVLQELASGGTARSDRLLAAALARELLVDTFGFDDASLQAVDLDLGRYEQNGIALLPWSSPDLSLTAMMAIVAPERLDHDRVPAALREWLHDGTALRERRIIALAGLAGLGGDVLTELQAIDTSAVSIREALWTALGLVAAGDVDGARSIERRLLEQHGQALGPWVRLDVDGSLTDTLDGASLLALVAAGIGDPLAANIDRYVREVHTSEALYVLPEIGVIRWSLDRLPRPAARFAWTVDGARHVEALAPGASWAVAITERQRAGFQLETLEGALAVVASWTQPPGPADLPSGDLVTITRTVTPSDNAPTTGLVTVKLHVAFAATAPTGCWEVTDRTPSGLAPIVSLRREGRSVLAPYEAAGQRVSWCLDPHDRHEFNLGYSARVVSPGTFTWEPAVVQAVLAPEVGATTPVTSYTIR